MATFKTCIQKKRADGLYTVYIRVTHNRKVGYIKTDKVVDDKRVAKGEITDPYVLKYCIDKIVTYMDRLNRVNIDTWKVAEVIAYLLNEDEDISFSAYARKYRDKMINDGMERNARNYRWAYLSLEEYACTDNVMFSQLTSTFVSAWIDSLRKTKRAKEMYPICIRQIFKEAQKEYNDYDRGVIKIKTNPWVKVEIPRADTPEKKAITPEECRAFFAAPIPESKYRSPLPELARDVAMMIICLAGINTVDLYNLKKSDYRNGVIGYCRAKTTKARADNAYIEMRVPHILLPLLDKYKSDDEYLFCFHARHSSSDSFNANVNTGLSAICDSMSISRYCCYTFRHTWATVAQNDCGASMSEVGFGMNHSMNTTTRGYVQIDFTPAWELNEKVVNFIFFSDKASSRNKAKEETFERISKYNMVRGELWHQGKMLSYVEDSGYTSIDGVIESIAIPGDIVAGTILLYKIINLDKGQTAIHYRKKQ